MGFLTSIDKKLHKLNVGASILHAGIGVGMAAWYFTSKNRDPDKVKTSLYKLYTCGKPGEDAPCLKEVIQGNANGIMAMMLTFIFFTSMMHMVYACCRKWYSRMMGAKNNYSRWIEYSISATILLVAIMLSSDTKEFNVIFISIFAIIGVWEVPHLRARGRDVHFIKFCFKGNSWDARNIWYHRAHDDITRRSQQW